MKRIKTCSVEGCDRMLYARGLCMLHYARWRSTGDPGEAQPRRTHNHPPTCSVEGCDGAYHAKGYCSMHHKRFLRYGDPTHQSPIRTGEHPTPHSECVLTITRTENDRWRKDNAARFARWDAVRTALWHNAHAVDAEQIAAD